MILGRLGSNSSLRCVPKPSNERRHFHQEYKGRNGMLQSVPKTDVFGVIAIVVIVTFLQFFGYIHLR